MGVTECDNMLMLLGVSNKMTEKVRGQKCCVAIVMCMCVNDPNAHCETLVDLQ